MTNFDFLKSFNKKLYELGVKLEEDVLNSPRAVPADATLFLESLVEDISRASKYKIPDFHSFYKKINYLYRSGAISYVYKNKLQEAYNLRSIIHKNPENNKGELEIALDLHQRLYYVSKKYFIDFSNENERYIDIPEYRIPNRNEIHFKNCIICGCENDNAHSNMCKNCNLKIETGNYLISLKNYFQNLDGFDKKDLIDYGLSESTAISLILNLTRENLIEKRDGYYLFNESQVMDYIDDVNNYVNIGLFIDEFFNNEITSNEIIRTLEYQNGENNIEPYVEFYNIVNNELINRFEKQILDLKDIKKTMKETFVTYDILFKWFKKEKYDFKMGKINESFILFNELLINEYFIYKKKGIEEDKIREYLHIFDEIYDFWINDFTDGYFEKRLDEIKKNQLLTEIKKDISLKKALNGLNISENEFERIYDDSKKKNNDFYKKFNREYEQKRQRILIRNLNKFNLKTSIKRSKITDVEFNRWYFEGEKNCTDFYLKSTEILMDKYLNARKRGLKKEEILNDIGLANEIFDSWTAHDDLELFREFKSKNHEITSNLLKRGLIINALKEDKTKAEAIAIAGIDEEEFNRIYWDSKNNKNSFYRCFDKEYLENRKRIFIKHLKNNDFYNAIEKTGISQKEFRQWYDAAKKEYLSNKNTTDFYEKTTRMLMDKYISARKSGHNKPDSAKSIGLSNNDINYWIRHDDISLFRYFKLQMNQFEINAIVCGFKKSKSKLEVSKINDISIKTVEKYIRLGKNGDKKYKEIYDLFISKVVPMQLDIFLEEISNKPIKKALKLSNLSEYELNYYYNLGKKQDSNFKLFYQSFLKFKIDRYVEMILSKKSHKIALKHSYLSKMEFKTLKEKIVELIDEGRLKILVNELSNFNHFPSRLAKASGLEIEEIYDIYFKGKCGNSRYQEFSHMFEMIVIVPRVMAITRAASMGVPKNRLLKSLKKELGSKDFEIWQKYGFIDNFEIKYSKINANDMDNQSFMKMVENSEFYKFFNSAEDPEMFEYMKKAFLSNGKFLESTAEVNVKH